MSQPTDAFSVSRLLMVLVPVIAVALAVQYMLPSYEKTAQAQFEADMLEKLLKFKPESIKATQPVAFKDADGDLLTDFPEDDATVKPEKLVFSYVGPAEESEAEAATWDDLVKALGEATGLPVEYKHYKSTNEQIAALASGELHIVGLNTGSVPMAVEVAGFHPICTLGREDGSFGYTMKLLARSKDGVAEPKDLKGKEIAFTTPDSNSGCKAAVDYLMNDENLLPERDYKWGFTFSHDTSVKELIAGEHDAVPVASDLLAKMIDDGEVSDADFKVIYESERFPPAAIGYAHNLSPELREQITRALLEFNWEGTSVAGKYGPSGASRFVPVNYKNDWANIRRINSAVKPKS
ncbi:phosphate/phosphite/phosphonate ABC transporter substrate-binding protein [Botrimarina mediterranea]|uniref:ABC transporter, phosphonate, periplasmic substrate-binding protein n=1 Tax=Botrimarina mediterranea TaxID=2528022 RepID=A0A518K519_9BACT|nr:phosphate/phosphite/phosphonate ABC transporter substrate-binding protein [Botrimarina mediterranea]QDV72889.1 ABC transporter, phosphonate, periplasmic substrate-binding protein [Botrimarina mediterranea]